jgi:adenylate kinase
MIAALTGTPGTGKTTISKSLSRKLDFHCLHLADLVTSDICIGYDEVRGCVEVNLEKLREVVEQRLKDNTIIEGHLSHRLGVSDIVIVLRTRPSILRHRLKKRMYGEDKIRENLEAEALDFCLVESMEEGAEVYEVDTSVKSPREVEEDIVRVLEGKGDEFRPGKIDWSEEYFRSTSNRRR